MTTGLIIEKQNENFHFIGRDILIQSIVLPILRFLALQTGSELFDKQRKILFFKLFISLGMEEINKEAANAR